MGLSKEGGGQRSEGFECKARPTEKPSLKDLNGNKRKAESGSTGTPEATESLERKGSLDLAAGGK